MTRNILFDRLHPGRFLFDPSRMTPEIQEIPVGRRLLFSDVSGVLDFEAEITLFGGAGGQAHAAFVPRSPGLIRALGSFSRKHGMAIPARFDRRWSDCDDPNAVGHSLDDMIRKTVENMHMVHTAAPALLSPFPLEFLASADPAMTAEPVPDEPLERRLMCLRLFFPDGAPVLDRNDRSRLLRNLMTDEQLLERPGDPRALLTEVAAAIRRMEMPREEWLRGDDGEPLRPAPVSLVLARLTNIRWMNETAEVYATRRDAGLHSSFGTFVSLLAALPEDELPGMTFTPSCAAASAAARLINWMTAHLNFYPLDGLGHKSDRIDFITTRLLFEEILNPFYAACVMKGREDLIHLPPAERLRILRALRDGFLHESSVPPTGQRGWADRLGGLFGRTPAAALPVESVSPLSLFRAESPLFFAPLNDADTAVFETLIYGVGRSIADGREYWSEAIMKRNLIFMMTRSDPSGDGEIDGPGIMDRAATIAASIAGDPVRWEDLTPRDQAYVTPAELVGPGFRVLPADWRSKVRQNMKA